jgi:hypothetical protein
MHTEELQVMKHLFTKYAISVLAILLHTSSTHAKPTRKKTSKKVAFEISPSAQAQDDFVWSFHEDIAAPASSLPEDYDNQNVQAQQPKKQKTLNLEDLFNHDHDAIKQALACGIQPGKYDLVQAIYEDDLAMVEILTQARASLQRGKNFASPLVTALHTTCKNDKDWSVDITRYLMEQGANIHNKHDDLLFEAAQLERATALIEFLHADIDTSTVDIKYVERKIKASMTALEKEYYQVYLTKIILALSYDVSVQSLKQALKCTENCYAMLKNGYARKRSSKNKKKQPDIITAIKLLKLLDGLFKQKLDQEPLVVSDRTLYEKLLAATRTIVQLILDNTWTSDEPLPEILTHSIEKTAPTASR